MIIFNVPTRYKYLDPQSSAMYFDFFFDKNLYIDIELRLRKSRESYLPIKFHLIPFVSSYTLVFYVTSHNAFAVLQQGLKSTRGIINCTLKKIRAICSTAMLFL